MLKEESNNNESGVTRENKNNNKWARTCDTCRSAACSVYCEADAAYLCTTCDAQIHAANSLSSRHERVRVCESCESAPAAFLCKADAASLCVACDSEIHSANPLASRHQRVPILPGVSENSQSGQYHTNEMMMMHDDEDKDEDEVASWLLLNPAKTSTQNNGFLFGVEYLDLVDYNSNQFEDQYSQYSPSVVPQQKSFGGDGVVPLQVEESRSDHHMQQQSQQLGINNYGCSSEAHYNTYNGSFQDLNQSVSVSSMDTSNVPESSTSDSRTPKETILDQQQHSCLPTQLSPMDREARVLRYREKKKTRKFEKTIRYASRKAYAEIRPRIKGRFAKRVEIEDEGEQMFSTSIMPHTGYGIVPSF